MSVFTVTMGQGQGNQLRLATWANMPAGSAGPVFEFVEYADRCFQVTGTFGTSAFATVLIQGSNDGINWSTLTNLNGSQMSFTAAGIGQANEVPLFVQPSIVGGDAGTNLTITCMARKVLSFS